MTVQADMVRASDMERRTMVEKLGRGLAVGCLTVAEFDQRAAAAWAARTRGELAGLAADLPTAMPSTRPVESRREIRLMHAVLRVVAELWIEEW